MLFNWKLFPGTNLQDLNLDWIINFVKMIPSRLPKFSDHHTWLVYDYSTGEYYDSGEPTGGAGEPGEPGKSPIIGANGNWYTWNTETETYADTGTRAQGVQGEPGTPGAGVAAGGVAGDVLVKASGVDYNTGWTATPPQMGALAHINAGNTADRTYNKSDYLVYNGQLYVVTNTTISEGEALNADLGGNIAAITATTAAKNESIAAATDSVVVIDYNINNVTIGSNGYVSVGNNKPTTPAGYGVLFFTIMNATYSGAYEYPIIDGRGNYVYGKPDFTYTELNCRAIFKRI